ncbi:Hypp8965 [Branchiostoma lanceolatum]|uniref:Hypp8965 protein n=1 Tax=Branchiostoma lanceolatum TaxID=7740 RepID=A0A8K0EHB0_BRALA|nr:Hypp8965 [Branchiostoma lanceolatum]
MFSRPYRNRTKPRRRLSFDAVVGSAVAEGGKDVSMDRRDQSNFVGSQGVPSADAQTWRPPTLSDYSNCLSFIEAVVRAASTKGQHDSASRGDQSNVAGNRETSSAGTQTRISLPHSDYFSNRLPFIEAVVRAAAGKGQDAHVSRDDQSNATGDGERSSAGTQTWHPPHSDYNSNRLSFAEYSNRPYPHQPNDGQGAYGSLDDQWNTAGNREGSSAGPLAWSTPRSDYNSNRLPFAEYTSRPYPHHPVPGHPGAVVIYGRLYPLPPSVHSETFRDYVGWVKLELFLFKCYDAEMLLQTGRKGRPGRAYFCKNIRNVIKKYEVTGAGYENFDVAVNEMLVWCPTLSSATGIKAIEKAIRASVAGCRSREKIRRQKAAGTYVKGLNKRAGERKYSLISL